MKFNTLLLTAIVAIVPAIAFAKGSSAPPSVAPAPELTDRGPRESCFIQIPGYLSGFNARYVQRVVLSEADKAQFDVTAVLFNTSVSVKLPKAEALVLFERIKRCT